MGSVVHCFFLLIASIVVIGESKVTESETESKRISMRFKDASLEHILEFISDATGYTIVKSADLDMRVTIISPDDMPLDEAFSVLNTTLAIKGLYQHHQWAKCENRPAVRGKT